MSVASSLVVVLNPECVHARLTCHNPQTSKKYWKFEVWSFMSLNVNFTRHQYVNWLKMIFPFSSNATHSKNFNKLKKLITSTSVLKYYNVKEPIALSVDSLKDGAGILQNQHPVAYAVTGQQPLNQHFICRNGFWRLKFK